MIPILIVVAALVAVACWVCLSPARTAVAAVSLALAHPALTFELLAVVAAITLAVGVVIVLHSLRESGWRLVVAG